MNRETDLNMSESDKHQEHHTFLQQPSADKKAQLLNLHCGGLELEFGTNTL
jgi:hypothetical protein